MTTSTIASKYEYLKDSDGDINSAVFPMREYLKKENTEQLLLGGSIETGISRFDDLGVPVGLYLERYPISLDSEPVKSKQIVLNVIDDNLFEKLLHQVSKVKPQQNERKKTKRVQIQNTEKKTKKQREPTVPF